MAAWSKTRMRTVAGLLLVISVLLCAPVIIYYFGNFYSASPEQFKNWYPALHLVLYPLVKVLPFLFLFFVLWLLRDALHGCFQYLLKLAADFPSKKNIHALKRFTMNAAVMCVSAIVVLIIAEVALRIAGMKPGFRISSQYFTEVDSLYLLKGFIADSNGILCVDSETREYIRSEIATKNSKGELLPLDRLQSTEVYTLPEDYIALRYPEYKSQFKKFLSSLGSEDSSELDFTTAVQEYVKCPINANGFKSIAFKKYASKRKSILLLGDSFTWGHSSSNKTNGFGDLLLTMGYIVYNTGITSTDPAQYLQLAKILIPQLQPDYVVVNFYMGNDIFFFERKPKPFIPVFYCTNAGNLISCPEGIYFYSPQEAYAHTLDVFKIPIGESRLNNFCAKTVIGTLFWRMLAKLNLTDVMLPKYADYYTRVRKLTTPTPYSDKQIKEIKAITERQGGKFFITVIPSLAGNDFLYPNEKQPLLTGISYHVPPITLEHYEHKLDGHYNDLGHRMHAEFIDSLIKNTP